MSCPCRGYWNVYACCRQHSVKYFILWNGWSLSSWSFPFMGTFDFDEDLIPLIQSPRDNKVNGFIVIDPLCTLVSSSLYHSMTINSSWQTNELQLCVFSINQHLNMWQQNHHKTQFSCTLAEITCWKLVKVLLTSPFIVLIALWDGYSNTFAVKFAIKAFNLEEQ